jgi:hypothetical protein
MISKEYRDQLRGLHEAQSTWGNGPRGHILRISKWIYDTKITELLDYGCGKGKNIPHMLPISIVNYDPGVPQWDVDPRVCRHLMCMDVLEHIEPEHLDNVLTHIASKFTVSALMSISLAESRDILPDGRNAHILIRPATWWIDTLQRYFTLNTVEFKSNVILVFITPKQK